MSQHYLKALFNEFIKDSQSGKRLRKNGERIKSGTINNYRYTLKNLELFEEVYDIKIKVFDYSLLEKEDRLIQRRWWKSFYHQFTQFLYEKGCHDNYVGANVKNIRTFFNYLNTEKDFITGNFYKQFYVRKENVEILVLSPEQLKKLIHDTEFEENLTSAEKRIKDVFVFGCTTGLRFSDLYRLTKENFEINQEGWYLKTRSKKTKIFTSIKLPDYVIDIIKKRLPLSNGKDIFSPLSLFIFNRTLKNIGEKAGFTKSISHSREKRGISTSRLNTDLRFCDKMSSHMMRRTAITTMLTLGMPEHMVKKISGHQANSKSFNRYIHYSNAYLNNEIGKYHQKLNSL